MEIRGLGGINGINNKNNKVNRTPTNSKSGKTSSDNVQISDEAKKLAEMSKFQGVVESSPDVRADKIKEVKARMESGYYNKPDVMNDVAEKLLKVLGF